MFYTLALKLFLVSIERAKCHVSTDKEDIYS